MVLAQYTSYSAAIGDGRLTKRPSKRKGYVLAQLVCFQYAIVSISSITHSYSLSTTLVHILNRFPLHVTCVSYRLQWHIHIHHCRRCCSGPIHRPVLQRKGVEVSTKVTVQPSGEMFIRSGRLVSEMLGSAWSLNLSTWCGLHFVVFPYKREISTQSSSSYLTLSPSPFYMYISNWTTLDV